ncbi:pyrimidine/purine nucleoside phosphorylase [Allohahella marinimesophila]|uniref:Pyrimidine/purine nucleoside phosphorylase n=1 Tax=Allohahella marinimesophila TaxID=1054972 RepID=A0ABP7NLC4_9GAMM
MSQFDNVSVLKKASVYFDGKVISHTILFAGGEKKTLGVMLPGEYRFGTEQRENMAIQSGQVEVRMPDAAAWVAYKAGESFDVPANSSFNIRVLEVTDYCCAYFAD